MGLIIRIRKFKSRDAPKVASLVKNALNKVSAQHYPKNIIRNLVNAYSADSFRTKMKRDIIFVATLGHKIVGTARLTEDGWLCGLFVDIDHLNSGIGKRLVGKIKQVAKQRGFDALRLHVAINSVGFYKKLGFRIVKKVVFKEAGETYRVIHRLR